MNRTPNELELKQEIQKSLDLMRTLRDEIRSQLVLGT
jgi:hypothetical protein